MAGKATSNGVWTGDNPVEFSLLLLIIQLSLIVIVSRGFGLLLRPLRQPRVIGEILGGIVLGASVLGNIPEYTDAIFPASSLTVLTTVANFGLLYFLFMVGLELDLSSLLQTGRAAIYISATGIAVPFSLGVGVSFVIRRVLGIESQFLAFVVFMGVAMSITAFPVLARILAERKLLTTDVGQIAMSVAAVDDITAWILLALAIALSSNSSGRVVAWILLCALAFLAVMFVAVRPLMAAIGRRVVDNEPISEWIVAVALIGVLFSSFATDVIGIHGIFGAFVFGLIIPKEGPFAGIIMEKVEDFTMVLLLPLYFASSGLNVRFRSLSGWRSLGLIVLVISVACLGKIGGTIVAAVSNRIPIRKAVVLGVLMNTKGLVELIVLNIGLQKKVINQELYTIMVIMALVTTFITSPLVSWLYPSPSEIKDVKKPEAVERRVEGGRGPDLRLLVCSHGMRTVPGILNLMEMSRGARRGALRVFLLHLVEYSERSSSIMMVTRVRKNGKPFWSRETERGTQDQVAVAFQAYSCLSKVTVAAMTAISGFADMHEDICSTADEKKANLIILPYHKYMGVDGQLESAHAGFHAVNRRVLRSAPCSVAVLVDRGLGGAAQLTPGRVVQQTAVLFFGGPDDREALAVAARMAEHPGLSLSIIRFIAKKEEFAISVEVEKDEQALVKSEEEESEERQERKLDEEALELVKVNAGKEKAGEEAGNVIFEEREVTDAIAASLDVAAKPYDLIIIGRGRRPVPLVELAGTAHTGPSSHSEASELGPIGQALASSDGVTSASVLVVQQHDQRLMLTGSLPASGAVTPGYYTVEESAEQPV